jgi:23S rRNA pseudouridine1911/1915/1917 synthase
MALESKSLVVETALAGQRIDRAVQQLCDWPREQVTGLFQHDCVQRNGVICREPWQRLQEADRVELHYDGARKYHARKVSSKPLAFDVIYEDQQVIVVNKPPSLLTVPTPYGERNTLIHQVTEYLTRSKKGAEAFVAHRLDRGVSGLLVFGKSLEISRKLRDQFELRKPQREYLAIVRGTLEPSEGTFRSYLATDDNLTRFSTADEAQGQLAITHFRTVQELHDASVVQIWLETGRRNQIRVHFAEAGHPVLGDPRYLPELADHPQWRSKRIALHARSLGFTHPVTQVDCHFESPLPGQFVSFIRSQGARSRREPNSRRDS